MEAGSATAGTTFPFTVLDELMVTLERDGEPWTVQAEVEVPERLDADRTRAALLRALAVHPLARARREPVTGLEHDYTWRVVDEVDVEPFAVAECPAEDDLSRTRRELHSTPVPLALAPPLRARLAHAPGRDVLMLSVHHAACDGMGAMRLLRSVAAAYGDDGAALDDAPVDLAEARDVPDGLLPGGLGGHLRRVAHQGTLVREALDAPARIAPDGGREEPGYRFVHRSLPAAGLGRGGRSDGPTANDRLLAALHLAVARWNAGHDAPAGRVTAMVPVNLRPAAWRDHVVSNFAPFVTVATTAADRASPPACVAAVHRATRRLTTDEARTWLLPVLRYGRPLPLWLRGLVLPGVLLGFGDRIVDTVVLSNLGRVDPPAGLPGAEDAKVWFSPPARMPLGLALGVATVGGEAHVVFRHRPALLDGAAAERFADGFAEAVDDVRAR